MNSQSSNWKNNVQNQFDIMNLINVLSFLVSVIQLYECDNQNIRDDISHENNKQSLFLLEEIKGLFKKQNDMLEEILERLD